MWLSWYSGHISTIFFPVLFQCILVCKSFRDKLFFVVGFFFFITRPVYSIFLGAYPGGMLNYSAIFRKCHKNNIGLIYDDIYNYI